MNTGDLIKKFSDLENVPVDVDNVKAEIEKSGVVDEVYFWGATIDGEKLKGQFVLTEPWEYPEGAARRRVADIYYDVSMTDDWQRLVCCKELLHILDPEGCQASTEAEVERLFARLALPRELQEPVKDGAAVITDRVAVYQALAVLFPMSSRNLLMPKFKEERITLQDIAGFTDLPLRYTQLVMHEIWDEVYPLLVS
ncbi:MAG: hypothetical protein KF765_13375 [Parvibaculaceae bacterium]|nr:hypothetical protein [Parvibaculaceae bacterium]